MSDDDLVDWEKLTSAERVQIMSVVAQDSAKRTWTSGPPEWRKGVSVIVILSDVTRPERVAIGSAHDPSNLTTAKKTLARALRVAAEKLDPLS